MKKIGIITIIDYGNYGNRLQNYALKKYIEQLSNQIVNVETVNYKYSKFKKITNKLKRILINTFPQLSYAKSLYYDRENLFKKFSIQLNNQEKNNQYILNKNYDYIVIGSDQIFNPNVVKYNPLGLIGLKSNSNVITYAPSFGISEINNNYKKDFKKYYKNINYISTREDSGKKILEGLTDRKDVVVLVDPTMLLDTDEWDKVSKKPKQLKDKKYILNYFLGELSEERKKEIEKIAKENDCDIINILDKNDPLYVSGPSEFLYLEKHAFLICTDSFHSSVFAILYNRPFIIFDREQEGIADMSSRTDTLINKFKLKNRKYNGKCITKENLEHDYTEAYKILEMEREKARKFLKEALDMKDSDE